MTTALHAIYTEHRKLNLPYPDGLIDALVDAASQVPVLALGDLVADPKVPAEAVERLLVNPRVPVIAGQVERADTPVEVIDAIVERYSRRYRSVAESIANRRGLPGATYRRLLAVATSHVDPVARRLLGNPTVDDDIALDAAEALFARGEHSFVRARIGERPSLQATWCARHPETTLGDTASWTGLTAEQRDRQLAAYETTAPARAELGAASRATDLTEDQQARLDQILLSVITGDAASFEDELDVVLYWPRLVDLTSQPLLAAAVTIATGSDDEVLAALARVDHDEDGEPGWTVDADWILSLNEKLTAAGRQAIFARWPDLGIVLEGLTAAQVVEAVDAANDAGTLGTNDHVSFDRPPATQEDRKALWVALGSAADTTIDVVAHHIERWIDYTTPATVIGRLPWRATGGRAPAEPITKFLVDHLTTSAQWSLFAELSETWTGTVDGLCTAAIAATT